MPEPHGHVVGAARGARFTNLIGVPSPAGVAGPVRVNRRLNLPGITGYNCLRFECANIKATVEHPREIAAALIVVGRRCKVRVARINGGATTQQLMREGRTAVVLQWT